MNHQNSSRRFAVVDIKLLRLGLVSRENGPIEGISVEWVQAQPTENLSPFSAAQALGVKPWSLPSIVESRYRKLTLRFPPEQCAMQHMEWRPAADLLGSAVNRLNWYWQSGKIPDVQILETASGQVSQMGRSLIQGDPSVLCSAIAAFQEQEYPEHNSEL
jgi:hypothetical protein